MSEKWKATPNRYWCKHCKVFVRDTPLERTQHEASPRHQGNLKRFLGDLHKNKQLAEREKAQARSEIARLEGVVSGKAPAPIPIQRPSSSKPLQRTSRNTQKEEPQRAATREDRKRQLEQLIALGVAIPEELRSELAVAGDWVTTKTTKLDVDENSTEEVKEDKKIKFDDEENEDGVGKQDYRSGFKRKRATDLDEELGEDSTVKKGWGQTFKEYPGRSTDSDELDELFSRAKKAAVKQEDGIKFVAVGSEDHTDEGAQNNTPEVTEPANEEPEASVDESVVFKKRKPKPLRQK